MRNRLRNIARRILPSKMHRWLILKTRWPAIGCIQFGDLRQNRPIGTDENSIKQYYINRFLNLYSADISGNVLLIGNRSLLYGNQLNEHANFRYCENLFPNLWERFKKEI